MGACVADTYVDNDTHANTKLLADYIQAIKNKDGKNYIKNYSMTTKYVLSTNDQTLCTPLINGEMFFIKYELYF